MSKIIGRYLMPHPPIIIPEIGQGEEERVIDTVNSMKSIAKEIKNLHPKTIVIITPHGPLFRDAIAVSDMDSIYGDFSKFGNSDVKLKKDINVELTKKIIEDVLDKGISVAPIDAESASKYDIDTELDHGALVPLYYIDKEYCDYNIVHITYGILSKSELYNVGIIIKDAVNQFVESAVIIASGDLSHSLKDSGPYEYNENGAKFDKKILSFLEKGDTLSIFNMDKDLIKQAGECALRSIHVLLGTLDKKVFKGDLLSYEGTFGVGYGVMGIEEEGDSFKGTLIEDIRHIEMEDRKIKKSESPYVNLVRKSLEYFLTHNEHIEVPNDLPENMLTEERGVFVTYKMEGELRGCIGTIFPTTQSVASEIIRNSVEAGISDPRFSPINLAELPFLEVSVDELMKPEIATFDQLDPKNYGIIVRADRKTGLLLPDLEGVDIKEQQLEIALKKAGIDQDEDYKIERFKVIRHR